MRKGWLNSYAKFGGAARRHFSAIWEKPMGGGHICAPPPAVRGLRQLWRGILEKMASEYDAPISHRLNISAKNISRELGEPDFSRGRDRPHSIDLPREHIVWSFRGATNASYWAAQLAEISNTIA